MMDTNPCEEPRLVAQADAVERLMVTRSNFAASIRQCQTAGMSHEEIAEASGVSVAILGILMVSWGLDR